MKTRSGFTLVELAVSVVILSLVVGSVALLGTSNQRAFRVGTATAEIELLGRRAADHIVQQLMLSGTAVLDPALTTPGSFTANLSYQRATGLGVDQPTWSNTYRLRFAYEIGELDDGLDNNGNGLIDEGRILWTEHEGEANERTTTLCRFVREHLQGETPDLDDDNDNGLVDEPGFVIERKGDALVLRLTLEAPLPEGGVQTRTIETSVKLRN